MTLSTIIQDKTNLNTYLNIAIIIFAGLISYITHDIREDVIENRSTIRSNQKENISIIRENQRRTEEKLDLILSKINNNAINITRMEEKQNHFESLIANCKSCTS